MPLRPSTHHPFWARHGDQPAQWINSSDLRIGDRLFTMDGNWRAITAIAPVAGEETVYNFTADKDHDYFVGETGFLVHNAGGCNCWPDNPQDMNDLLGFEGEPIPDLPGLPGPPDWGTPGRNRWIWKIAKGVEMRFEQHPYFGPGAAACETEPHWQIKVGKRNIGKWMPGDPIPGIF